MIQLMVAAGSVAYLLGATRRFEQVHTALTYASALIALPFLYLAGMPPAPMMIPFALCAGVIGLAAESLLNHALTAPRLLRR